MKIIMEIKLKYIISVSCALCWISVLLLLPDYTFPIAKEYTREVIGQTIIFYASFLSMILSTLLTDEETTK